MSDVLIGAVITALTTLVISYKDELSNILSRSSRNIAGRWKGKGYDLEIEDHFVKTEEQTYEINFKLKQWGKMVKGEADVDLKDKENNVIESNNFKLKGSFKDKDYVFLEYKNQDKNKTDYGSLLMFLHGNGKQMHVYSMGRSRMERNLALVSFKLEKR